MKLRIFGSGAVIYDAVDQIDPILVSSDFKSPNQTSQTRVASRRATAGGRVRAPAGREAPGSWLASRVRSRPHGAPHPGARTPRAASCAQPPCPLSDVGYKEYKTLLYTAVHTHLVSERAPKGGWRIQRCRAARDRLRRISAGERATRKG